MPWKAKTIFTGLKVSAKKFTQFFPTPKQTLSKLMDYATRKVRYLSATGENVEEDPISDRLNGENGGEDSIIVLWKV